MNFENQILTGLLLKRYKRFFVDVKVGNKVITAHCPNTGSMQGLLTKGNKVGISKSNNKNRKLKYTLQYIEDKKKKVGINTHLTNKIVLTALKTKFFKEFKKDYNIKSEQKYGKNTRFDFLITSKKEKIFIEVKNVTLSRENRVAEFPDAVTSRGAKHIKDLIKAKKEGYLCYLLFVIQREDCDVFKIAKDIDPEYSRLLTIAKKNMVKVICFDCKFSSKGIKLHKQIKFIND